ncbi:MAG: hypothetical protein HY782_13155 [Chloroflexi bacterium]|nr:hypothetical protein [Chloroflexota bacterium]
MKTVLVAGIVVVLLVAVGVGAFLAGSNYGQAQAQNIRAEFFTSRQQAQGGAIQPGQGGGPAMAGMQGQFGRGLIGTVKSVDGNKIQLTQRDGSVVTVTMDSQTQIQKTMAGAAADIKTGENITVLSDQTGSDVTARTIQIRAAGQ